MRPRSGRRYDGRATTELLLLRGARRRRAAADPEPAGGAQRAVAGADERHCAGRSTTPRADRECRVVIIAGAGPAFCAGHDLREMRSDPSREAYERIFAECSALMQQIVALPKPVIAEVHGIATAAGCQLVATCDLAVAAEDARFATPGVNIGLFCSTPMVALTRAVGRKAAMEMLLTGELIDAATAKAIGLVNRVVPAAELSAATMELARQIAAKSAFTRGDRQGGVLPAGRDGSGRRLSLCRRGDDPQHAGARRRRRHRRVSRKAAAGLAGRLSFKGEDRSAPMPYASLREFIDRLEARRAAGAGRGAGLAVSRNDRDPDPAAGRGRAGGAVRERRSAPTAALRDAGAGQSVRHGRAGRLGHGPRAATQLREVGETLAFLKQPEPPGGWREALDMLPLLQDRDGDAAAHRRRARRARRSCCAAATSISARCRSRPAGRASRRR